MLFKTEHRHEKLLTSTGGNSATHSSRVMKIEHAIYRNTIYIYISAQYLENSRSI